VTPSDVPDVPEPAARHRCEPWDDIRFRAELKANFNGRVYVIYRSSSCPRGESACYVLRAVHLVPSADLVAVARVYPGLGNDGDVCVFLG